MSSLQKFLDPASPSSSWLSCILIHIALPRLPDNADTSRLNSVYNRLVTRSITRFSELPFHPQITPPSSTPNVRLTYQHLHRRPLTLASFQPRPSLATRFSTQFLQLHPTRAPSRRHLLTPQLLHSNLEPASPPTYLCRSPLRNHATRRLSSRHDPIRNRPCTSSIPSRKTDITISSSPTSMAISDTMKDELGGEYDSHKKASCNPFSFPPHPFYRARPTLDLF